MHLRKHFVVASLQCDLLWSPLTLYQGWSLGPIEYSRSDSMSLLRLDYKRLWLLSWVLCLSFSLSLSFSHHSLWGRPVASSWGHWGSLWRSPYGEVWRSLANSGQQPVWSRGGFPTATWVTMKGFSNPSWALRWLQPHWQLDHSLLRAPTMQPFGCSCNHDP